MNTKETKRYKDKWDISIQWELEELKKKNISPKKNVDNITSHFTKEASLLPLDIRNAFEAAGLAWDKWEEKIERLYTSCL